MKITSVRKIELETPVPVYDLTSPKYHNFALANGCVVHNSAKRARDARFQEVFRLTGKPANAARMKLAKLLDSKVVVNLLLSIGYNFDTHRKDGVSADSKLRVNKLFLLPDADVDGSHIAVLLMTLLYKLMPSLFDEGRVHVVDAPLFSAFYKNKRYFGDTHQDVAKQLPKGAPSGIIMRAKGWGEIGHEMLAHVAFNPETRKTIQVKAIQGKDAVHFERLVGNDSQARKELLGL